MQKILSKMRKAIEDYNMINEGDKIAVALSGGKDSIALLYALKNLQLFYPKKFEIMAITVNPGFDGFDTKLLERIASKVNVELINGCTSYPSTLPTAACSHKRWRHREMLWVYF